MTLNMEELITKILQEKKGKRNQPKTKTPEEETASRLAAAKTAYDEYLKRLQADADLTPEKRASQAKDFWLTTLRKNNLPNDTELPVASDEEPQTPTEEPPVSEPVENPKATKGKKGGTRKSDVNKETRARLRQLAGIKEPDLFGGKSVPEPVKTGTEEPESTTSTTIDPEQIGLDLDTKPEPTSVPDQPNTSSPEAGNTPVPSSTSTPRRGGIGRGIRRGPTGAGGSMNVSPATLLALKARWQKAQAAKAQAGADKKEPDTIPSGGFSTSTTSVGTGTPAKFTPGTQTKTAEPKPDTVEKPVTTEPPKPEKPETPTPSAEPKKSVQPWSQQGREARAKELADMSPEEKAREKEKSMRRMGFVPDKRSFLDRVKTAGKAFVAPAGSSIQTEPTQWKSRFAEVLQMMEELQQVEHQLYELSLAEGLVGGQKKLDVAPPYGKLTSQDFARLRARRKQLREALVKEMIHEELEKHSTTLAELNPRQRTALMEYVKKRSTKMWEMMAEARMNETAGDN